MKTKKKKVMSGCLQDTKIEFRDDLVCVPAGQGIFYALPTKLGEFTSGALNSRTSDWASRKRASKREHLRPLKCLRRVKVP